MEISAYQDLLFLRVIPTMMNIDVFRASSKSRLILLLLYASRCYRGAPWQFQKLVKPYKLATIAQCMKKHALSLIIWNLQWYPIEAHQPASRTEREAWLISEGL